MVAVINNSDPGNDNDVNMPDMDGLSGDCDDEGERGVESESEEERSQDSGELTDDFLLVEDQESSDGSAVIFPWKKKEG